MCLKKQTNKKQFHLCCFAENAWVLGTSEKCLSKFKHLATCFSGTASLSPGELHTRRNWFNSQTTFTRFSRPGETRGDKITLAQAWLITVTSGSCPPENSQNESVENRLESRVELHSGRRKWLALPGTNLFWKRSLLFHGVGSSKCAQDWSTNEARTRQAPDLICLRNLFSSSVHDSRHIFYTYGVKYQFIGIALTPTTWCVQCLLYKANERLDHANVY